MVVKLKDGSQHLYDVSTIDEITFQQKQDAAATSERTVLVYMAAENNLSSYADDDLNEMAAGSQQLSEGQTLLAFVDKQGSTLPQIVRLAGGEKTVVKQYAEDFYSSDPQRMHDVLLWVQQNYPASDYGLVLWGHASGWTVSTDTIAAARRAYGVDYGTGGGRRWMNITQLAKAMKGLKPFRYILTDCCAMMCIENAYELRSTTEYLIGSPAEIPGNGAPYDLLTKHLFSTSQSFYKDIVDTYYDYYTDYYNDPQNLKYSNTKHMKGYSVPLAAVNTTRLDALGEATAEALATFAKSCPEEISTDNCPFYFSTNNGQAVMYDMMAVMKHNAQEDVYNQWEQAFRQAVTYSRYSAKWTSIYNNVIGQFDNTEDEKGGCVSFFVPKAAYNNCEEQYNSRCSNFAWYNYANWSLYGWQE